MKKLSATYAALAVVVVSAIAALPALAATGSGSGGASPTQPQSDPQQPQGDQQAPAGDYRSARASWYGPGLYGNHLACGGKLTRNTLGVAHKSLPCGTKVAVQYHGTTVVVPVIDRGPYSRGVSYDLTQATARELGMTATSRVRVAPVGG
jgi:rare lipoprotein A (peptidoglycan hydrolase)